MTKERAIEIIANLERTINTMTDNKLVESDHTLYKSFRAKKSTLRDKRDELIKKYKL